jgi:hypothetical protein
MAEVGDIHSVKVNNAIVREAPDKSAKQVSKLGSGAEIMEMDVQGEWYEVYVASSDLEGWMHVSTLALLGGGAPVVPAATQTKTAKTASASAAPVKLAVKSSAGKSQGMKEFEKYLLKYNARTNTLKGYIPFSGAEDKGNGELQLTVTNQWLEKSIARQKSSLITLYTRWKKINASGIAKVYAVDPGGNPIISYPK